MRKIKAVLLGVLGLVALKAAIDAGKARRVEQARMYLMRTGDLDKTLKLYKLTKDDLLRYND